MLIWLKLWDRISVRYVMGLSQKTSTCARRFWTRGSGPREPRPREEPVGCAGGEISRTRWKGWSPSLREHRRNARSTATAFGSVWTLDGKISSQEQPHSELKAMDALPKPT